MVFTDVRYPNELSWIQDSLDGVALHISRINNVAPNNEEAHNDPLLSGRANMKFSWGDFNDAQPSRQDSVAVQGAISKLMKNPAYVQYV